MESMQTIGKGIMQGINQFIDNDLQNYVPLFVIAAVVLTVFVIKKLSGLKPFQKSTYAIFISFFIISFYY